VYQGLLRGFIGRARRMPALSSGLKLREQIIDNLQLCTHQINKD
jgi:hypothetical protein